MLATKLAISKLYILFAYQNLKFYKIDENSDFLKSLVQKNYLKHSDYITELHKNFGSYTHTTSYMITPSGIAVFENKIKQEKILYWTNIRSWISIIISIIAVIVSIFL